MRKEKLLEKKQDAVEDMVWYAKMIMTDEDIKKFSIPQLKAICEPSRQRETLFFRT